VELNNQTSSVHTAKIEGGFKMTTEEMVYEQEQEIARLKSKVAMLEKIAEDQKKMNEALEASLSEALRLAAIH